jgi:hypothetical protein
MTILIDPRLQDSEYALFSGRRLADPKNPTQMPSKGALKMHRQSAGL